MTNTTYKTSIPYKGNGGEDDYYQVIVNKAIACNPKQLDLATTAAYFQRVEINDPWGEVNDLKTFDHKNGIHLKSRK